MANPAFTKMVLVPEGQWRQGQQRPPARFQSDDPIQAQLVSHTFVPEHAAIQKTQHQLKTLLDDRALPDDVKAKLVTHAMMRSNALRESSQSPAATTEPGSPIVATDSPHPEKEDSTLIQALMMSLTEQQARKASALLSWLSRYRQILSWDDQGQMIYKTKTIPRTNIADLVGTVIRQSTGNHTPPRHLLMFTQALMDCNVPDSMIVNSQVRKMLSEFRRESPTKTPLRGPTPSPLKAEASATQLEDTPRRPSPYDKQMANTRKVKPIKSAPRLKDWTSVPKR